MSAPMPRQTRQLVDSAFDGTLDGASKARLIELLRTDPTLLASFESERTVLASLRQVSQARDLTDPILAAVERRRGFLSGSQRLRVWAGRGALAASLLLAAAGIAVFQRAYPNVVPWSAPAPVSEVVTTARADAAESIRTLADAMNGFKTQAVGPLASPERAAQRPHLAMGETRTHEKSLTYRVAAPDAPSASGALSATEFRAWKLGAARGDEGFVVSRASWTDRSAAPRRALCPYWDACAAMQMSEEASAAERSWLIRFWMNSQLDQGGRLATER